MITIKKSNPLLQDKELFERWLRWRKVKRGQAEILLESNAVTTCTAAFILGLKRSRVQHLIRNQMIEKMVKERNYLTAERCFKAVKLRKMEDGSQRIVMPKHSGIMLVVVDDLFIERLERYMMKKSPNMLWEQ